MADKREQILARLLAIGEAMKTAGDFESAVRNRGLLTTEQRPAFVLLDGGELPRSDETRKGRVGFSTQINLMRPEVFILPKEVRPTGQAPALVSGTNVGTIINGLRMKLANAIATDSVLIALVGSNGEIKLEQTETDLTSGGAMAGEMQLHLAIAYVFDPTST